MTYKNLKLLSRYPFSTLLQLLTPAFCVIIVYSLQCLAEHLGSESARPFNTTLPFAFAVPLNLPQLVPQIRHYWNTYSCVRINQIGYFPDHEPYTPSFVEETLLFSNALPSMRKTTCNTTWPHLISPFFNRSEASDPNALGAQGVDEIRRLFDSDLSEINKMTIPSDAMFLFRKAGPAGINAALMANNMKNMFLHRDNLQTSYTLNGTAIPLPTEGFLSLIDLMSNGLLESETGRKAQIVSFASSFIGQNFRMTFYKKVFQVLAALFFPLALSLGFPLALYFLALEKEQKIRTHLELNGLRPANYWLSSGLFYFLVFNLNAWVFFSTGKLLLNDGFFSSPIVELLTATIGWNLCQVSLSFILLSLVDSASSAAALGLAVAVGTNLAMLNLNQCVFPPPAKPAVGFRLLPGAALSRIVVFWLLRADGAATLGDAEEYKENLLLLFVTAAVCGALGLVLNDERLRRLVGRIGRRRLEAAQPPPAKRHISADEEAREASMLDNSSLAAAAIDVAKIFNAPPSVSGPKGYFFALGGTSLAVRKGEVLGLLGPNGAGKTTLISVLAGQLSAEWGSIRLAAGGSSICPQFDILWPELNAFEHLKIFGGLRGLQGAQLAQEVSSCLSSAGLDDRMASSPVGRLSGGQRRRVSLATALVGGAPLVFLDEPSTGLDPRNRREFWQVIRASRANRTFIVSTHLMEEAEFLSDRLAVITTGVVRAVGTPAYLRREFCAWKIVEAILSDPSDAGRAEKELMESIGGTLLRRHGDALKIRVEAETKLVELMRPEIRQMAKHLSLKPAGLDDVLEKILEVYA